MGKTLIGIGDKHPLMTQALAQVLVQQGRYTVTGISVSQTDLVALLENNQLNAVIVDPDIFENGFNGIKAIATEFPKTRIIIFTDCEDPEQAIEAMKAGARSYVLRSCTADELISGLEAALAGEVYFAPRFAARVIGALQPVAPAKSVSSALSVREKQIVNMLLLAKSNREIAVGLQLTENTIKRYMSVLMRKLRVHNRLEVVMVLQQQGQDIRTGRSGSGHRFSRSTSLYGSL